MELEEMLNSSATAKIERPENIDYSVAISQHIGVVTACELLKIRSGIDHQTKEYLQLKITLDSESDNIAELVVMTEYSWLPDSNMIKLLIDLKMLPQVGEAILMKKLLGIHVDLVVQALDYEGLLTTSVVEIKRKEDIEIWPKQEVVR